MWVCSSQYHAAGLICASHRRMVQRYDLPQNLAPHRGRRYLPVRSRRQNRHLQKGPPSLHLRTGSCPSVPQVHLPHPPRPHPLRRILAPFQSHCSLLQPFLSTDYHPRSRQCAEPPCRKPVLVCDIVDYPSSPAKTGDCMMRQTGSEFENA